MRSNLVLLPNTEPFPGYTLRQRIGRGGFAEVWEATSPTGARIALKFMRTKNLAAAVLVLAFPLRAFLAIRAKAQADPLTAEARKLLARVAHEAALPPE